LSFIYEDVLSPGPNSDGEFVCISMLCANHTRWFVNISHIQWLAIIIISVIVIVIVSSNYM